MSENRPVSVGALMADGVQPHPHEAVAVILQLCEQISRRGPASRVTPAISASTVAIDAGGAVTVVGGEAGEDNQTVPMAGRLLVEMLDHCAPALEAAVLPRLRAMALRAASGGRGAFGSASQFVSSLRRFGPEYGDAQAVRALFNRWAEERRRRTGGERRVNTPPPDMMRRFLREAELEARLARVEARPAAPAGTFLRFKAWAARGRVAVLVGATLLVLAGAGFVFLVAGRPPELPVVVPAAKPTPVLPRRQPAWELLRRPDRAMVSQPPRSLLIHGAGDRRELTVPPSETAVPGR